jgi:F-type H+-transporting ATPase subunit b
MELLTPDLGLLFWQVIVFGVLFFILAKYAWKPILSSLAEREQSISDALEMAAKTRQEMAELKAGNEKLLADARAERDGILKDAREIREKMITEAKSEAAAAAKTEIDKARTGFENEKNIAITQLKKDTISLVVATAEKVLRKELSDKTAAEKLVTDLIGDARMN